MMALLQDPPGRRCRDRLQDEARITQDRVMDTSRMENESRSGWTVDQEDRDKLMDKSFRIGVV
ncbi:TPA: hypothetical protein MH611_18845 [Klebsiella pneumoniae]|nr:hypothetical protein [Klebsiella pneumoniae]HDS7512960.1 hypothetical protein [Klebsiella pneumoniae subsp. pneumoniae]MBS2082811.1 hypothetical protein [Klebsiella pneumoniae]QUF91110.1 hypothetical protein KC090_04740 [Klebsiella pneumoniae]HBQ6266952.1 hypothetical protein [Klebsiella pneumoniae]